MERKDTVSFNQSDFLSASFAVFQDMRIKKELCDVKIMVRNSTLVAHRVILAAGIPHFRSVFTGSGSTSEEKEAAIGDIDPTVLESLIHFAYTGQINICSENAQPLLLASESLQVNQVADACIEFLSERLDIKNVTQVRTFALDHNQTKLTETTKIYIRNNFESFCESVGFLHLSHSCIKEIISGDDLRISSEKIAFEAVMNWVKFSPSDRGDFLQELLSEVRIVHVPIGYLTSKVVSEDLIRGSIPCRQLIQDVQSYQLLPEEERSLLKLKTQSRRDGYTTKGLYAVCLPSACGGYSVYHCDFRSHAWNLVMSEKQKRSTLVGIAAVNESIYLFLENSTTRFHLKTLEWEVVKSTQENLEGSTILCLEHSIYFFGSFHPEFQRVRHFDTSNNMWLKENTMARCCFGCGAAFLQDLVYITGGSLSSASSSASVETYNPETTKWNQSVPMLRGRQSHGCANSNGKIYVGGGFDAAVLLTSAEVFDPHVNKWNTVSFSLRVGGLCSFIQHENKIYVFRRNILLRRDVVEIYDPADDEWVISEFPAPAGLLDAVSISKTDK